MTISCIIPFYNEEDRLYAVLDQIIKVSNFMEVILVDDGSLIDHSEDIKRRYQGVRLFRLQENKGKTEAIREGLKRAKGELVMLFDADLRHVDHKEIEATNDAMLKQPDIDMLILRQINEPKVLKLLRGDVLTTGERLMKKSDLEIILSKDVERWQLESAINHYMFKNRKKVYWVPFSGRNTYKAMKWGLNKGSLLKDLQTQKDIWTGAGMPYNLVRHYLFFGRKELKHAKQ